MNKRLQSKIQYSFNDPQLLERALSHRSMGKQNNERLEFLGDSLLGFIIAEELYKRFPDEKEGVLTRLRSVLVRGETLAELALDFDLGEYLKLGEGELKSGGFRRASILADSVEAIIGAIYLDSDMATCKACVLQWYESRLKNINSQSVTKDPKTRLQEYLQEKKLPLPEYRLVEELGKDHAKEFVVDCSLRHIDVSANAKHSSKRNAEKLAAQAVLQKLGVA